MTYRKKIETAVEYIQQRISTIPEITLILGSGLSGLAKKIEDPLILPFETIPHFPKTTVESHIGTLIFGRLAGKNVAVLQGRVHYYEGYSTAEITFPVRVLSLLGSSYLFITNAAGGLNPDFQPGSLLTISDHLNFISENPLRGENIDDWGPRFPDMSETYDKDLSRLALEAAKFRNIQMETGIYACIPGPSLETPAETRFFRNSGADAIGMSTVPEVIVAKHAGMRVLGISVLANINDPDNFQPITLEDVLKQVHKIEPDFQKIIMDVLEKL